MENRSDLGGYALLVLIFLVGYWLGKRARRGGGIMGAALSVVDGGRRPGARNGLAAGSAPYPSSPETSPYATAI